MRSIDGRLVAMKGARRDEAEMEGVERSLPPLSFASRGRGWWGRTILWAVFLVVLIECAFIVRLDILNSSSTSTSFTELIESTGLHTGNAGIPTVKLNTTAGRKPPRKGDDFVADAMCSESWLEKADKVEYSRNFQREPVMVVAGETEVLALAF